MKNLIFVALVVLFTTFGCSFQKAWSDDLLTRDQAIAILIEQVITPRVYEDYYMAFGPQTMLTSEDTVRPADLEADLYPGNVYSIQGPTWFFWIDTDKWAKFVHLVHYVYIDASHPNPTVGDGIIVKDHGLWPKINGIDYLETSDDRAVTSDIVYGEVPIGPPTVPPRDQ